MLYNRKVLKKISSKLSSSPSALPPQREEDFGLNLWIHWSISASEVCKFSLSVLPSLVLCKDMPVTLS